MKSVATLSWLSFLFKISRGIFHSCKHTSSIIIIHLGGLEITFSLCVVIIVLAILAFTRLPSLWAPQHGKVPLAAGHTALQQSEVSWCCRMSCEDYQSFRERPSKGTCWFLRPFRVSRITNLIRPHVDATES